MKFWLTCSLVIIFISPCLGQGLLRDVSSDHWASDAVYELVNKGLTSGFPDGTFRGKKEINRYSFAVFLAKLAANKEKYWAKQEKLLAELKAELAAINYQRRLANWQTQWGGQFLAESNIEPTNPNNSCLDYRLKLNLGKNFAPATSLKVNLDTMDAGFAANASSQISKSLIDLQGNFRLGSFYGQASYGPGRVVHSDSLFPLLNQTIFERPKTALSLKKSAFMFGYVVYDRNSSSLINWQEVTARYKAKAKTLSFYFQPRYFWQRNAFRDVFVDLGLEFKPDNLLKTKLKLSTTSLDFNRDNIYLFFSQAINNHANGDKLEIQVSQVGSNYRRSNFVPTELVELNNFQRNVLDGSVDFGLTANKSLSQSTSLNFAADYVTDDDYQYGGNYPESYFVWQIGVSYRFVKSTYLTLFYSSYKKPDNQSQSSNLIGLTLKTAIL